MALYQKIEPYNSGYLTVSNAPYHKIFYEEYGNPKGEILFLFHGGPGQAPSAQDARFFNPQKFRIIIHHQRGCGKSHPLFSIKENTTYHLLDDALKLLRHLEIEEKIHLFGGSWGSFLCLAFAIENPHLVKSLTLRAIMLCRNKDLYDLYQRDVLKESRRLYAGAAFYYPNEWEKFVNFIPENEHENILAAYHKRIHNLDESQKEIRYQAAKHWFIWESTISTLKTPSRLEIEKRIRDKKEEMWNYPILASHYFLNGCFVGKDYALSDNFILENIKKIAALEINIVQGRYDMATPRNQADELIEALNHERKNLGLENINVCFTNSGHDAKDEENKKALMEIMDEL